MAENKIHHLKTGEEFQTKKIKVDCEFLQKSIDFGEKVDIVEEDNLRNISHLKIVYENDLLNNSNHQVTADKVFNYLGLKSCKVNTLYRRITPEKLEDIILNYDEVYNYFKDTKYIKYFN
ncbi:MAG: hypothetical protein ABI550_06215 [Ignavibacteriaceae bacterium]